MRPAHTTDPSTPRSHHHGSGRFAYSGVSMDTTEALDLACWSARDLLVLTTALRETAPRDPLRALENAVLDLVVEG